ncbi:MAG TPA: translation factor GTPase family protein [Streptosporangiaceae bacterium]|jgi:ribosomal protection tetracycline resistance protein
MPTVNIGILAHVDAGKTSLTERLLYDTGVIDSLGSVDAGTTRTDGTAVERRRGITVRAAVAALPVPYGQVNLLDTPGHSEFVAEVARVLDVLDAAILVVSAVDGVQPRTRVLMRTLRRMRLPTLVFVNKIDRPGARCADLVDEVRRRLAARVVPMADVRGAGGRAVAVRPYGFGDPAFAPVLAEVLADADDGMLARLVDGPPPSPGELRAALWEQAGAGRVHPLYFGSAITGAGVSGLLEAVGALPRPGLPRAGAPEGRVFAVRAGAAGESVAFLRLSGGELRSRTRVAFWRPSAAGPAGFSARVADLRVVTPARAEPRPVLRAGEIAEVRGPAGVRAGDRLGAAPADGAGVEAARFAGPSLESVVRAADPADEGRVHAALRRLGERDPLVVVRGDGSGGGGGTVLGLYGEVQKEVIAGVLAEEFGVRVVFAESRAVYLERPAGTGEAVEAIGEPVEGGDAGARFWATVGLRVAPGPVGGGVAYGRDTELGALPRAFDRALEAAVRETLAQGLYGWPVADCAVTLTRSGYVGPLSVAGDFRALAPLVLMRALARAGTAVYEPVHAFELEIPADTLGPVTSRLSALGARITATGAESGAAPGDPGTWLVSGEVAARHVHGFQEELPGLSRGDGAWWSRACGDRRVGGRPPVRERRGGDPLNRAAYLRELRGTR